MTLAYEYIATSIVVFSECQKEGSFRSFCFAISISPLSLDWHLAILYLPCLSLRSRWLISLRHIDYAISRRQTPLAFFFFFFSCQYASSQLYCHTLHLRCFIINIYCHYWLCYLLIRRHYWAIDTPLITVDIIDIAGLMPLIRHAIVFTPDWILPLYFLTPLAFIYT